MESSPMVRRKSQKIEIEKFHPDPLLSLYQSVRTNHSNFCWTVLIQNHKSKIVMAA